MHTLICFLALLGEVNGHFANWVSETRGREGLPESIGIRLSPEELKALSAEQPTTPYADLTAGIRLDDGSLWVGSPGGLMHAAPGADGWRLFHSPRWLPDDRVEDLAVAADGSVWVETKAGTCRLSRRRWTLDEKMAEVHAMLRKAHLREGLVCEIHLNEPGTLEAGYTQHTNDNDGLWTSLYVAAEAFRYGVTGDPEEPVRPRPDEPRAAHPRAPPAAMERRSLPARRRQRWAGPGRRRFRPLTLLAGQVPPVARLRASLGIALIWLCGTSFSESAARRAGIQ